MKLIRRYFEIKKGDWIYCYGNITGSKYYCEVLNDPSYNYSNDIAQDIIENAPPCYQNEEFVWKVIDKFNEKRSKFISKNYEKYYNEDE